MFFNYLKTIISPAILVLSVTVALACLTLVERKIIGSIQLRKGPDIAWRYGLAQPLVDGLKLFIKEPVKPLSTAPVIFFFAPIFSFCLALLLWAPLPMPIPLADLNLGILILIAFSSLAVYSILGAGWGSTSIYPLVGALRAVAQTISYEVILGLILLAVIFFSGAFTIQSFSIAQEKVWIILPAWPLAFIWYISTIAETNRAPFDLTEGESELVSGFNIEYAAGHFALFFLAEYANILLINALSVILFLGTILMYPLHGSSLIIIIKTALLSTVFIWVRASYPRLRYDQLIHLVWKNFLPLTLALIIWHLSTPIAFAGLPPQL